MGSSMSSGRKLGVLLLLQMAFGLITPFVLLRPPMVSFPDYLPAFAANSGQVRIAIVISIIGSVLTLMVGLTLWPVLRRYSEPLALAFVAICAISCVLDLIQDGSVMSMLSMSERYVQGGSDSAVYQAVGAAVQSSRKWAHYTQLFGFGAWIFTFYLSMLRSRLMPWVLSLIGILGILSQFIGVTLLTFLGLNQVPQMAMVLAPIHLAAALWLIVKGLGEVEVPATEVASRTLAAA